MPLHHPTLTATGQPGGETLTPTAWRLSTSLHSHWCQHEIKVLQQHIFEQLSKFLCSVSAICKSFKKGECTEHCTVHPPTHPLYCIFRVARLQLHYIHLVSSAERKRNIISTECFTWCLLNGKNGFVAT